MADNIIPITGLDQAGVIKDPPAVTLPPNAFSDARNVRFRDGCAQKMRGEVNLFPYIFNSDTDTDASPTGQWAFDKDDIAKEVVYIAWWSNPHVSDENSGYYLVILQEQDGDDLLHNAYILEPENQLDSDVFDSDHLKGSWVAHPNADWQHTFFQGGFALVVNNGVDVPRYLLDTQRDNQTIATMPNFVDLPGWESYRVDQELFEDTFDENVDVRQFDLGQVYGADEWTIGVTVGDNDEVQIKDDGVVVDGISATSANNLTTVTFTTPALPTNSSVKIRVYTDSDVHVRAGVIRSFGDFLVAGNLRETNAVTDVEVRNLPGVVRVSDAAPPGGFPINWNPYAVGVSTADEHVVTSDGVVQDMVELQGALMIYSNASISALRLTGNLQVPTLITPVTNAYGCLTTDAVIEFDGKHFVVGSQDIYLFSGHPGNIQSLSDKVIRRSFYELLNPLHVNNLKVIRYAQRDEIWLCFPSTRSITGELDLAYIYNYRYNNWTLRDLQSVVAMDIGPIPGGGLPTTDLDFDPDVPTNAMTTGDNGYVTLAATEVQGIAVRPDLVVPRYDSDGVRAQMEIDIVRGIDEVFPSLAVYEFQFDGTFDSGPNFPFGNRTTQGVHEKTTPYTIRLEFDSDGGGDPEFEMVLNPFTAVIQPWDSDRTYFPGQRVTYEGTIYELQGSLLANPPFYYPRDEGYMYVADGNPDNPSGLKGRFHYPFVDEPVYQTMPDSYLTPDLSQDWISLGPVIPDGQWEQLGDPIMGPFDQVKDIHAQIEADVVFNRLVDVTLDEDYPDRLYMQIKDSESVPPHNSSRIAHTQGADATNGQGQIYPSDTFTSGLSHTPTLFYSYGPLRIVDTDDPSMQYQMLGGEYVRQGTLSFGGDLSGDQGRSYITRLFANIINEDHEDDDPDHQYWTASADTENYRIVLTGDEPLALFFQLDMIVPPLDTDDTDDLTEYFTTRVIERGYAPMNTYIIDGEDINPLIQPRVRITIPADEHSPSVFFETQINVDSDTDINSASIATQLVAAIEDTDVRYTDVPIAGYSQPGTNIGLVFARDYTSFNGIDYQLKYTNMERVVVGSFDVEWLNYGSTGLIESTDKFVADTDYYATDTDFLVTRAVLEQGGTSVHGTLITSANDFRGAYADRATPTYVGILLQNGAAINSREFYVARLGSIEQLQGDWSFDNITGSNGEPLTTQEATFALLNKVEINLPRIAAQSQGEGRVRLQPANYDDLANFVLDIRINDTPENATWIWYRSLGFAADRQTYPANLTYDYVNPDPELTVNAGSDPLYINVSDEQTIPSVFDPDNGPFKAHFQSKATNGNPGTQNMPDMSPDTVPSFIYEQDTEATFTMDAASDFTFDLDRPWPKAEVNHNIYHPIMAQVRVESKDLQAVRLNKIVGGEVGWSLPLFSQIGRDPNEEPNTFTFRIDVEDSEVADYRIGYESYVERKQLAITPEFETEQIQSLALWVDGSTPRYFGAGQENFNNLQVNAMGTENPGRDIDLSVQDNVKWNNFAVSEQYKVDMRTHGRFMNYRVTDKHFVDLDTDTADGNKYSDRSEWRLAGLQAEIVKQGRR